MKNQNPYFSTGKRCMHKGKKCYTREEAAKVRDHQAQFEARGEIRIYCCPFCNFWHLTHHRRNRW